MNFERNDNVRQKYITQLDKKLQIKIEEKLLSYFETELELSPDDVEIELELAMNSRIYDLEDTININEIINKL